ncbi:MAG: YeeE/YedE family protein [Pseudomonadota bacterium]
MNGLRQFTPGASLVGGILIGASASLLLLSHGRVAGITGVVAETLRFRRGDVAWRLLFLLGMVGAGSLLVLASPASFQGQVHRSAGWLLIAGLLVGFGTRMGNGCTSGHGVCGIARLSKRSVAATLVFMVTGALTVAITGGLGSTP